MIISLINQKGGVGKTTTVFNLGHGLRRKRKRILLIDLDPQANLTGWAGINAPDRSATDIFTDNTRAADCIHEAGGLDLIPVTGELAGIDIALGGRPGWESRLRRSLADIQTGYDYILVDCPPSLGLLTVNALVASRGVLIPVQTKYLTLAGLTALGETIGQVRDAYNRDLRIIGIVPCMYDCRTSLAREVIDQLNRLATGPIFKTIIRENIKLAEAPSWHKSIFDYAPRSHGAEDYENLTKELLRSL